VSPNVEARRPTQQALAALNAEAARYQPTAPFAGTLRDIDPDLRPGTWLNDGEPLARLIGDQGDTVIAYVDEDDVARIAAGDTARFRSDGGDGPPVKLQVIGVEPDASRTLPEPELANAFGGTVVVREKNGEFQPERPVYRVTLKALDADAAASRHTWRGTVTIAGRWEAPAWRYVRAAAALVRREAGF
jgi:putative peptide zinc metalloprotease protein